MDGSYEVELSYSHNENLIFHPHASKKQLLLCTTVVRLCGFLFDKDSGRSLSVVAFRWGSSLQITS